MLVDATTGSTPDWRECSIRPRLQLDKRPGIAAAYQPVTASTIAAAGFVISDTEL